MINCFDGEKLSTTDKERLQEQGLSLPLNYEMITRYLPHRYPLLLIDRVTALAPGQWITGIKNVSANEELFNGHFPNQPVLPGVLMVEAMAQLSGILGFVSHGQTADSGYLYLFAGIDKARFKKVVIPGDVLVLRSQLLLTKHDIFKFACTAHVDDKLVASAEIMVARQKNT